MIIALMVIFYMFSLSFWIALSATDLEGCPEDEERSCHSIDSGLFAGLVIVCAAHQIMNALICRAPSIVFDYRFISTLGIQLSGFFGCLAMANKLGVMFPVAIPLKYLAHTLDNKSTEDL
jgi:hypothetical protein